MNEVRGITIIFVTHEADIAKHTRRVVRLADGVIVEDQPVAHPRRVEVTMAAPVRNVVTQPDLITQGATYETRLHPRPMKPNSKGAEVYKDYFCSLFIDNCSLVLQEWYNATVGKYHHRPTGLDY